MKGTVGENSNDYGEVQFVEEGLTVFYRGYYHGAAGRIILSYISTRWSKVINHSLEINELIYWYWWLLKVLGINIYWLISLVESDK